MSDLWFILPAFGLTACAALALRWQCHALSIVFSLMAATALMVLL